MKAVEETQILVCPEMKHNTTTNLTCQSNPNLHLQSNNPVDPTYNNQSLTEARRPIKE